MVAVVWVGWLLLWVAVGCDGQKPYSYQYFRTEFGHAYSDHEANRWLCVIFGLCSLDPVFPARPELALVYQWNQLEFAYSSESARRAAIDNGYFIPGVPAPIDTDVHYSYITGRPNRVFVTIPRFQGGIPVTLGVVTDRKRDGNPIIEPYPNWSWHTNPKQCKRDRLISVYRVFIDECQRLWVLDTGRFIDQQTCPPQILAFDLSTNQIIHRYEIPSDQIESRSILVNPQVDVRNAHAGCTDTFVYVADCQTYSIIVHDVQRNTSWKATDKTMYPYPNYGTYTIAGDSFDLMDGVLGMALEPYKPGTDRKLFYHAMSSPTENWVYTSHLKNRTRFIHDSESSPEIFHTYRGTRNTQSAAEAIDRNGIMFFGLMTDITIDCWNTATEYGPATMDVVASNKVTLQFASGVKVVTNTKAMQELWVLTSRFQKIGAGTLDSSEVNFRIQAGKVDDLLLGTKCKSGSSPRPGGGYGLIKPN